MQAVFVLSEVFRKELQDQPFQDKMEFMTEQGRPEQSAGRFPAEENCLGRRISCETAKEENESHVSDPIRGFSADHPRDQPPV